MTDLPGARGRPHSHVAEFLALFSPWLVFTDGDATQHISRQAKPQFNVLAAPYAARSWEGQTHKSPELVCATLWQSRPQLTGALQVPDLHVFAVK